MMAAREAASSPQGADRARFRLLRPAHLGNQPILQRALLLLGLFDGLLFLPFGIRPRLKFGLLSRSEAAAARCCRQAS